MKITGKHIEGCALLNPRVGFLTDKQAKELRCTCATQRKLKREIGNALHNSKFGTEHYGTQIGEGCYITLPKRTSS
jgi:hypothetical protein